MFDRTVPYKLMCLRLLQIALAGSIAMGVTIGKEFTLEARQAVFGQREIQFDIPYSGSTPIVLPPVLLVAHNAGNQQSTARRALKHDAAGMEIDVQLVDGVLYAAHSAPSGFMPMAAWQVPRLRDAWQYSAGAKVLKLDLKSTSRPALDALVRFVESRPSDQQILIVSSNPEALAYLDTELPEPLGFLSLSGGADIDKLLEEKGRVNGVDGVSVPSWALTAGRIQTLKEHGYLIDAWTVNDIERLVDLSASGVDIITTENLAFFDMALDTPQEGAAGS